MPAKDPHVLSPRELDAWEVILPALQILPSTLDTQMQRNHGLTFAGYLALDALEMSPQHSLRMRLLATRASMTMSRLSHLADRLEKSGYIERQPVLTDRRSTLAILTPKGLTLVQEARKTEAATVRHLVFGKLDDDQIDLLRETFALISSRLDPEDRGAHTT